MHDVVVIGGGPAGSTATWLIPVTDETMSVSLVVDRDHYLNCKPQPEELLAQTIAATPFVADRMRNAERLTQIYARTEMSSPRGDRFKLALFFALVGIQKRRPVIAPPIPWETLPAAASM